MVLKADVLKEALVKGTKKEKKDLHVIYPSPRGIIWQDKKARNFAKENFSNESKDLVFICGRYEGLDERFIQKYVDEGKVPGGVFQVVKDGKKIYNRTFGNNAPGDPYAEDDIWRIASMTKAITCTAIMQLVEQGKIGLDDPLSKFFQRNFDKKSILFFF